MPMGESEQPSDAELAASKQTIAAQQQTIAAQQQALAAQRVRPPTNIPKTVGIVLLTTSVVVFVFLRHIMWPVALVTFVGGAIALVIGRTRG